MTCDICPRNCKIDRKRIEGFCGMTENVKLAKADIFMWEEPCISGIKGSGTIFFSGCNLKCCFCQNYKISSGGFGKEISINRLAKIFEELEIKGVHNINLVSPSHYTNQIIEALKIYRPKIPIVWNSNGYEKIESIKKIAPYVDIFLVDVKFCDSNLSEKYCKANNYFEYASKAVKQMIELKPKLNFKNEFGIKILKSGVIVRHLVMPNCIKDSINILEWLSTFGKDKFLFSLMSQYTPYFKSYEYPEIDRPIKPIEYKIVLQKAKELGLNNGFAQELESGTEKYIPLWNLKGV